MDEHAEACLATVARPGRLLQPGRDQRVVDEVDDHLGRRRAASGIDRPGRRSIGLPVRRPPCPSVSVALTTRSQADAASTGVSDPADRAGQGCGGRRPLRGAVDDHHLRSPGVGQRGDDRPGRPPPRSPGSACRRVEPATAPAEGGHQTRRRRCCRPAIRRRWRSRSSTAPSRSAIGVQRVHQRRPPHRPCGAWSPTGPAIPSAGPRPGRRRPAPRPPGTPRTPSPLPTRRRRRCADAATASGQSDPRSPRPPWWRQHAAGGPGRSMVTDRCSLVQSHRIPDHSGRSPERSLVISPTGQGRPRCLASASLASCWA